MNKQTNNTNIFDYDNFFIISSNEILTDSMSKLREEV